MVLFLTAKVTVLLRASSAQRSLGVRQLLPEPLFGKRPFILPAPQQEPSDVLTVRPSSSSCSRIAVLLPVLPACTHAQVLPQRALRAARVHALHAESSQSEAAPAFALGMWQRDGSRVSTAQPASSLRTRCCRKQGSFPFPLSPF